MKITNISMFIAIIIGIILILMKFSYSFIFFYFIPAIIIVNIIRIWEKKKIVWKWYDSNATKFCLNNYDREVQKKTAS